MKKRKPYEKGKLVAAVVGAGPGNGAALTRPFVEAGCATAILSRHRTTLVPIEGELADTHGFECDVGALRPVRRSVTLRSRWRASSGPREATSR